MWVLLQQMAHFGLSCHQAHWEAEHSDTAGLAKHGEADESRGGIAADERAPNQPTPRPERAQGAEERWRERGQDSKYNAEIMAKGERVL